MFHFKHIYMYQTHIPFTEYGVFVHNEYCFLSIALLFSLSRFSVLSGTQP